MKVNDNGNHNCYNKLTLYFILVLAIVAVSLWTIFLIKLFQIAEETKIGQQQHIIGSQEARQSLTDAKDAVIEAKQDVRIAKQNVIESKEIAKKIFDKVEINEKNIENILGNVTEINQKLK